MYVVSICTKLEGRTVVDSSYEKKEDALARVKDIQRLGFHAHITKLMQGGFSNEWLNANASR